MFLNRPLAHSDLESARGVLDKIKHRGPDKEGEWYDIEKGVYLGHRRLSIIDTSSLSDQPMFKDGQAFIFNGELYNFRELRTLLKNKGYNFQSSGDGEVFFNGLSHYGAKFFDRVDSMFALAYWDGSQALLAVDAFGEKPLFYAQTRDGVFVCSEITPLAQLLNLSPEENSTRYTSFLSLGFLPQPDTFFSEIKSLPAGTYITVQQGKCQFLQHHWTLPETPQFGGKPKPISVSQLDNLLDHLITSLSRRLITDVPLTLFLSSGIDSSLVAALCKHELHEDLHCLTVEFNAKDQMKNEAPLASKIAKNLSFEHEIIKFDNAVEPDIDKLIDLTGQPSGMVGTLSFELVSQIAANQGFKVALTGLGGDEITAGYGKNNFYWNKRYIFESPGIIRTPLGILLKFFGEKGRNFSTFFSSEVKETYLAIKNYPTLDWLRKLPNYNDWVASEFNTFDDVSVDMPRYELIKAMPAMHLLNSDHSSMKHSLELRTPFLNKDISELISQWDQRSLFAFGQKSVLRNILGRYLPDELMLKEKTGFSYPRHKLLSDEKSPELPCLDSQELEYLWSKRFSNIGWSVIATRLKVLETYINRYH